MAQKTDLEKIILHHLFDKGFKVRIIDAFWTPLIAVVRIDHLGHDVTINGDDKLVSLNGPLFSVGADVNNPEEFKKFLSALDQLYIWLENNLAKNKRCVTGESHESKRLCSRAD